MKPKPLRVHPGPPCEPGELYSPIPIHIPHSLVEYDKPDSGVGTYAFKDFLYRDGNFYPIHAIKELKK